MLRLPRRLTASRLAVTSIFITASLLLTTLAAWYLMPQLGLKPIAILPIASATHLIQPIGKYRTSMQEQASVSSQLSDNSNKKASHSGSQVQGTSTSGNSPASGQSLASGFMGIYDTASPSDPSSLTHLDQLAQAGFNAVLNYTAWDGSQAQIKAYLDHAQQLNMKVIFSLKDFYSQEQNQQVPLSDVKQFGSTYEQVALNIVKTFKDHPAIGGWYISDERPETPADASTWIPVLQDRYQKIKQIDPAHPTIAILQCYDGTFLNDQANVAKVANVTDQLGFDTYPIPYQSTNIVSQCASTFGQAVANPAARWTVIQDFSWSSYPDVPSGQGYDLSKARFPTLNELKQMVAMAKQQGTTNFLLYSYFDLQASPQFSQHWQDVKDLIKSLPSL